MLTLALGFLKGWWKELLFAAALGIAIWFAYDWAYDRGAASRQHEVDAIAAEHNRQVAAAEAAARERENALRTTVAEQAKEIDDAHRTNAEQMLALQVYATTADAAVAAGRRLRDALATARLVASETAPDPAAACHARASSYEQLLARSEELLRRGRDLAIRCAGAHDDRAAEVRGLVRAWPQ